MTKKRSKGSKKRRARKHARKFGKVSKKICKFCQGTNIGITEQIFIDGSRHSAYRCLDCDKHLKFSKKSRSNKNVYQKRASVIKDLGFDSYEEYLDSTLWVNIRTKVLLRDNSKCVFCSEKAFTVHHSDYAKSNLSGKRLTTLHSVCQDCHYNLHFTAQGKDRELDKVIRLVKKCIRRGSTIDFRLCTICRKDMGRNNEHGYQKRCKSCNAKHIKQKTIEFFSNK
jgi:hypothetical protein